MVGDHDGGGGGGDFNRYMPGLAEGMEGVKAGEMREIKMTFPDKLGPTGGNLEGTKALFVVEAVEIKVSINLSGYFMYRFDAYICFRPSKMSPFRN